MPKKIFDIFPPKPLPTRDEEPQPFFEKTSFSPRFFFKKLNWLTVIFGFLILTGIFLHLFLAKVKIEIWPKVQTLNFQEKIIVNPETNQIDFSKKEIPGKIFEDKKSLSQQFSSSGKILKKESAQGKIRVYNKHHLPQTLAKNTRFQASLKKILYFCSEKSVVIPPKSQVEIEVFACFPGGKKAVGPEYNIGPSTFSIPGLVGLPQYYNIYGKSFQQMTGGYLGEINQVTEGDLETAKRNLLEKLETESKDYLKNKFSNDFILLDEGVWTEIIEASSSLPIFGEGKLFDFNLTIKSKANLFKKSDLDNFAKEFIFSKINQTQRIQPEKLKINYSLESIDKTTGKITLNLEISTSIYSDIDFASFKKGLTGKSLRETSHLFNDHQQIEKFQIKVFPFWLKKIPDDLEKIKIEIKFD